jgi:hypothetical protein
MVGILLGSRSVLPFAMAAAFLSARACEEEHRFQQYTYSELYANATFALIVEGFGLQHVQIA